MRTNLTRKRGGFLGYKSRKRQTMSNRGFPTNKLEEIEAVSSLPKSKDEAIKKLNLSYEQYIGPIMIDDPEKQLMIKQGKLDDIIESIVVAINMMSSNRYGSSFKVFKRYSSNKARKARNATLSGARSVKRGAQYVGRQASRGARYAGQQASRGARYVGQQASRGARYAGQQASRGARYVGQQASRGARYAGQQASRGARYVKARSRNAKNSLNQYRADRLRRKANRIEDRLARELDRPAALRRRASEIRPSLRTRSGDLGVLETGAVIDSPRDPTGVTYPDDYV